ncbi:leucine-rich repeat-containing protein 55-like [Periplaneta americana]|uniref:leucine-rich repeat-containing protein 55-like n=1 Tax=Periplaneta americana TaxID=6978 RepID=UPI0037E7FF8C
MDTVAVAVASLLLVGAAGGCPALCKCFPEYLECGNLSLSLLRADMFKGADVMMVPELYLDHNSLQQLPTGVFAPLHRLRVLSINYNSLASLPVDAFTGLRALEYLHLRDNRLQTLPEEVFASQVELLYLDLRYNLLTSLGVATLSPLRRLTALVLRGNPLFCDCALKPAATWASGRDIESDGECEAPPERRGYSWDADNDCAFPWRTLALATLVIPAGCLAAVVVAALCRRKRRIPQPVYDDAWAEHHYETIPAEKRFDQPEVARYVPGPSHPSDLRAAA